jgi:ring-1,2-phenylacetyl-CoA epoxidase subunit PaaE
MSHFHTLRVGDIQRETSDAVVVSFDVPDSLREAFKFEPGQYLTLKRGRGVEETRRSYSICAAPGEPLRVGVRRVPRGLFSPWLTGALRAGDELDVMEPQGRFGAALAQLDTGHVLLIAGGSGITPVLSILRTVLQSKPLVRCTLLYGNRRVSSTMFKEELEDLKNRYLTRFAFHAVFSREQMDSPAASGRLDGERLDLFLRTVVDVRGISQAFICGPHALNDEAEAALLAAGMEPGRVHVERFGVPPALAAQAAASHAAQPGDADGARISILRDGLTREVVFRKDDPSILDAAIRAGMDLPYSCKSGVCATCRAKLLEGQVRMDRNFALEPADRDAGFILTCQAHPLSDRLVVSFDER